MLWRIWLSAVVGLAFHAAATAGEIVLVPPPHPCPPLVSVKAGDPAQPVVSVNIPGLLRLEVGASRLLRHKLGTPILVPPLAPPPMAPVEGLLPAPRPLPALGVAPCPTHAEFAANFRPCAGRYEVLLLHPDTGRPVQVCFELPPGTPKVRVERRELEFDYDRKEVEIRFLRNGTVRVEYD